MSVTIPYSSQIDLRSQANGIDYRVRISIPQTKPPDSGYPTLWVLDGDAYFGFVTDVSRNLSSIGEEIAAPVVVAIGYGDPDPHAWQVRRALDLTPSRPGAGDVVSEAARGLQFGGIEAFLDTIESEMGPMLSTHWPLDPTRRVIFGHSFGGLAVVHTLFTRSSLFAGYIAVSPALYWNQGFVLAAEGEFARAVESRSVAPQVFLGVGGLEEVERPLRPVLSGLEAQRRAAVRHGRMIENARVLARRLQAIPGDAGYGVRFACYADETHVSVAYVALAAALRWMLPRVDLETGSSHV